MNTPLAHVLNGREIAHKYANKLAAEVLELKKKGVQLTLASVQAGDPNEIAHYARSIGTLTARLGIGFSQKIFPESISAYVLLEEIAKLNKDPKITGILVFSPLPHSLTGSHIINAVDSSKDVEGRNVLIPSKVDFDRFVAPPTALAAMTLILETQTELTGKEALVIGRSDVVGRPVSMLLLAHDATVTICHSKTKDLAGHVHRSDIVVAAAGRPEFIKGEWVKTGAVVIDVGDNTVEGHTVGDVEFETAKRKAAFISPVPGGVGPLTNVMLMKNLLNLYRLRETANGNY